jgi:hypothetical protein
MTQTTSRRDAHSEFHTAAFERRRRAAWIDYLLTTRDERGERYAEIEQAAWSRLERRLERNRQLLDEALASPR